MESTYKNTLQDYQNSLLEAINVLSKANDNKNVQTITVEAVIESVDDAAQGIYTVNYMGNIFKAYATGSSYQKEQQVYVLVPNGDFTKKKIIISAVGVNTLSQIQEDNSRYIFTSDNIIFDGDIPYSLCSYQNEHYVWNALSEDNKILFYKYSQKQRVFQLSCDIKTKLSPQQIDKRGYYYLTFTYATLMGGVSTPHQITLSVSNILGNPYQLNDWSNQKIIFKLDENEEVDKDFMPTLTLGCNNFIQNSSKTEKDIFFKNFTLQSLEDASLVKGYKLYLTADKGTYMRPPQVTSIKLVPELRYNGAIVDLTNAECFWFEQDAAITVEDEKFLSYGGPGWACLNQRKSEEDENGETFTYFVTDKYFSRTIMDTDIILNKFYKCIIIKENTTYSAEIEISQLNSDYALTVVADNKVYEKNAGNVVITASTNITPVYSEVLTFDWVRQDKNKKYISNDFYEIKKTVKNQQEVITFPTRLVNEINYVVCSLRSSVRGLLASKTIAISISEQLGYKLVIENGDVSYKYDASGKSQYLGAGYVGNNGSVQPIAPLLFKIYKDDGKELSTEEYLSCNIKWRIAKEKTLLVKVDEPIEETDEYYIFSGMSLQYDVANYYNKAAVNNKIFLDVVFGDKILSAVAQPHFIMDGAMGTNGTKINTVIRYKGYGFDEVDAEGKSHICKLIYQYSNDGNSITSCYDEEGNLLDANTSLPFILDVYIEGKKVSENGDWIEEYYSNDFDDYHCQWSIISIYEDNNNYIPNGNIISNNYLEGLFTPNYNNIDDYHEPIIIKAEIVYGGKIVTTYYPIDVIYDEIGIDINQILQFNLEGGFHSILYNSAGQYPIYDHTPFKFTGPDEYKNKNYDVDLCYHLEYGDGFIGEYGSEIEYNKNFTINAYENFNSTNWWRRLGEKYISIYYSLYIEEEDEWKYFDYYRPIVIMCNAYSLPSMNNWDGLKVQINDDESIYSPILGAGKKNSDNTFSGFIMGDIHEAEENRTAPRFTAYNKGIRTFNIDANTGKVTIGSHDCGGQIEIDPSSKGAIIKSSNYNTSLGTGMEINFSEPYIKFGSGKFKVDKDGKLTATGVDISGKITAGEGEIGGWKINTSSLTGGSVTLNKNGSITGGSTHKWHINADGSASFSNLTITGGSISWSDMAGTENIATKSYVTGQGYETAASIKSTVITKDYIETLAIRAGSVAAENITGTTITGKAFSGGSINIGNGTFAVDGNGKVTCSNLNVTGGEIKLGGYTLNGNGFQPISTAKFGNFSCDVNSIYSGGSWTQDKTPTVFMCTGSIGNAGYPNGQTIAGVTRLGWCFGAGGKFGVANDGNVYCSAIKISGKASTNSSGVVTTSTSEIGKMLVGEGGTVTFSLGNGGSDAYTLTCGSHEGADGNNYILSISRYGPNIGVIWGIKSDGSRVGSL